MKKAVLAMLFFLSLIGLSYAIDIDLTGSTVLIKDSQTIRFSGVTAKGFPGKYWAELRWDPNQFAFVPVSYGEDSLLAKPEGVWVGVYTSTSGAQFSSIMLITSTGVTGIDFGNGVFFIGSTTVKNNELVIIGNESVSSDALVTIGVNNLIPQQELDLNVLNGAYAIKTGDAINSAYDSVYSKKSSLAKLVATWSGKNYFSSNGVMMDWMLSISPDGTMSGSAGNFKLTGTVSTVDSNKNEYSVSMAVSDPSANYVFNGNYSGVAALLDTNGIDGTLLLFLEGDQQFKVLGKLILQRN